MNPKLINVLKVQRNGTGVWGSWIPPTHIRMQNLKLPDRFSLSLGITGDSEPQNHGDQWITEQSG